MTYPHADTTGVICPDEIKLPILKEIDLIDHKGEDTYAITL